MKRRVIVAAIVYVTLAAGGMLLATECHAQWRLQAPAVQPREPVRRSRQAAPSPRKLTLPNTLDGLHDTLRNNVELLVYGAIAGFGILMMGLAIGSA
jgi:hypothetical protein